MSNRIYKTVFSSNQELCHIWAQQTLKYGKAGNMFFEGDTLYSYGHHFPLAKVFKKEGIALIKRGSYSITTRKHALDAYDAVSHLNRFWVSDDTPLNLKSASKYLDSCVEAAIDEAMSRKRITDPAFGQRVSGWIDTKLRVANELRLLLGLKEYKIKKSRLDALETHCSALLRAWTRNNTPEAIELKAAAKAKRELLANAKKQEQLKESVELFRAGKRPLIRLNALPYDLLSVRGNELVTSRDARVPLDQARLLAASLLNGVNVVGMNVGQFTIDSVTRVGNDTVVKVGCHKFLLSEIVSVLQLNREAA